MAGKKQTKAEKQAAREMKIIDDAIEVILFTRDLPELVPINPELGYVKGNVQVVSRLAYVLTRLASPEELMRFGLNAAKLFAGDEKTQGAVQ